MNYRLALFDRNGRLLAQEPFAASDHIDAQEAACLVAEACNDVVESYEVRCNELLLTRGRRRRGLFNVQRIIDPRQNNVLDLLNRLQSGFTAVALSRRLSRITARLRRKGHL